MAPVASVYRPRSKRPTLVKTTPQRTTSRPKRRQPPSATINQPKKPTLGAMTPPPAKGAPPPPNKPAVGQRAEFDPAYYNRIDTANRKEARSLSDLDAAEQATRFDFGIEDPTNPFSRAQGLKQAYLARRKAASTGLAAQGQLYSGTHERAMNRNRMEEERARSELRAAYEAAIGQIGSQRAGVKFATEEERAQAFEDWLARAPEADGPLGEVAGAVAAGGPAPSPAPSPAALQHKAELLKTKTKAASDLAVAKAKAKAKPKPKPKAKKKKG